MSELILDTLSLLNSMSLNSSVVIYLNPCNPLQLRINFKLTKQHPMYHFNLPHNNILEETEQL